MNERYYELDKLVDEAINMVTPYLNGLDNDMYTLIEEQLEDIKINIIGLKLPFDKGEINQRYSLGSIAVKNFDSSDKLYKSLIEIFHLCLELSPEEY